MKPEHDPIFLVGSPRSGTTFTTRVINEFMDFHCARDKGVILRIGKLLPNYGDLAVEANRRKLVDDLFEDYFFKNRILQRGLDITKEQVFKDLPEFDYVTLINYLFTVMAKNQGKSRWANKYPSYALDIEEVAELFPTARFLHIIRDGRDVVWSMRNTSPTAVEKNWYYAGKDWAHHVKEGQRAGKLLGPERYMEMRYEELLQTPEEVMPRLMDFFGRMPGDDERLERFNRKIKKMIKPGNFYKWKKRMSDRENKIVEQIAGDTLQSLGYEIRNPEAIGKPFNSFQHMMFFIDNVRKKIFSRAFTKNKYIRYNVQEMKTKRRAAKGASAT